MDEACGIRKAKPGEQDAVFLMGFDAWSRGRAQDLYLAECRASPKYKRGRWYVLADDKGTLLSSLITYRFPENAAGIGSVATPPELRRRGYASRLISGAVSLLEDQEAIGTIFLFADIDARFYERFGFVRLPPDFQKHPGSVCMMRSPDLARMLKESHFTPPDYF